MTVLDPGHSYSLDQLDCQQKYVGYLVFVKREGPGFPGNVGHYSGTQIQEVLRALIDRSFYVDRQIPCWINKVNIFMFRMAINLLEYRAAKRHGFRHKFRLVIEHLPTDPQTGHLLWGHSRNGRQE